MKSSSKALIIAGTLVLIIGIFIFGSVKSRDIAPAAVIPTTPVSTDGTQKSFTREDVSVHNNKDDCYTIIGTNVYNVTPYISRHPGGSAAILGLCGTDGTASFTRQHGSNAQAQSTLASFFIGTITN
jgi:cytochrome b involved in lipid metabolism